jgi:hypothetical protein
VAHLTWLKWNGVVDTHDAGRVQAALVEQLGPAWRSFSEASIVTKVLLLRAAAAFHDLAALRDMDASLLLMMRRPPSLPRDMADVRAVVERYEGDTRFIEWIDHVGARHGFERTVVLGAVDHLLRHKGVVAFRRNDMPWLPFVDRAAWIAVHFHGWRVFSAECVGIFSHFQAEKAARAAIKAPQVEGAVDGIRTAWRERMVFDPRRGTWFPAGYA